MASPTSPKASQRLEGSFRDPSGYVFTREDRIFRAIDQECNQRLKSLQEKGALKKLVSEGKLVQTKWITCEEDAPLAQALQEENPGFDHFLEHDRLAHISYPYEWSFSMLADAAILTLDLQIELLNHGFSLKDATAYNVQFRNGRPVFIDLGSIEVPKRLDVWFALGQFQRHFLFPLLLCQYRGWDLRSYFIANLDGLPISQVAAAFPGLSRWSPKVLLDITLPQILEKKTAAPGTGKSWEASAKEGKATSAGQVLNLQRLRKKILALKSSYRTAGAWHDYTTTCTYDERTTAEKKRLIDGFLGEKNPASVLDLGCNTGDYSYLAAARGATVIAADADCDAVELLYRRLEQKKAQILPLVVNLGNPSPAIGYLNAERPAFLGRVESDCLFALALIHHLLVSANFTMAAIRDLFARLTRRYLVLEFVPLEDVQFQRILRFRENLFESVTLEGCVEVFSKDFVLLDKKPVADTGRTLLFMERRQD